MTQTKLKVISILLLLTMAFLSLTLSAGSIIIRGKGIVAVEWDLETGSWTFRCDNSSQDDCTLTVHYPTP